MNKLPKYTNCKNREIEVCDYFMHKSLCHETCAYALDIRGQIGVGAMTEGGLFKKLEKEVKK